MPDIVDFVDFVDLDEKSAPLSEDQKKAMIATVEDTGNITDAAILEGIFPEDLEIARKLDEDFNKRLVQAEARLKIKLRRRVYELAFEDQEIPIIGGPDKMTVGYEVKVHERMVELAAKLALGDELVKRVDQRNVNANVDNRLAGSFDLSDMSRKDQGQLKDNLKKALAKHDRKNG